jgi:hypothetical protein
MPYFFNSFPKVLYDVKKNEKFELATNITVRFKMQEVLRSRLAIYFDYHVQSGERADTVAFKMYDDPTLDWIIYLANVIIDPQYDWPMGNQAFINYIKEKYGSVSVAQGTVHHYEWIYQPHKVLFDGIIVPEKTYEVDLATYNTVDSGARRIKYDFDYEDDLNESKRNIKVINKNNISSIVQQVEGIFK